MSSMQWIRDYYGVPAKRGMVVKYSPCEGSKDRSRTGVITGARGPHLLIRMDGDMRSSAYHPTWQIEYPTPHPNADAGERE